MKLAYSPADWRALPKDGWHPHIVRWNRKYGHIQRIPRATSTPGAAFLPPKEGRNFDKQRKHDRKKPVLFTPHIAWTEVPQRLPYRRGDPNKGEDPQMIYVDSNFLEMVRSRS